MNKLAARQRLKYAQTLTKHMQPVHLTLLHHTVFPSLAVLFQAQSAHASLLEKLNLHAQSNKILWLTSPLTRAIETMMLAFPDVEALAQGKPGSSGIPLTAQPTNHKVKVLR